MIFPSLPLTGTPFRLPAGEEVGTQCHRRPALRTLYL